MLLTSEKRLSFAIRRIPVTTARWRCGFDLRPAPRKERMNSRIWVGVVKHASFVGGRAAKIGNSPGAATGWMLGRLRAVAAFSGLRSRLALAELSFDFTLDCFDDFAFKRRAERVWDEP